MRERERQGLGEWEDFRWVQVFKVDVKVFNGWRGFEVGVKCKVDVKVFDGCRGFEVGVKWFFLFVHGYRGLR